ncbi:MAG: protein translocase subunit SecD [Chloroflexota bacterium]
MSQKNFTGLIGLILLATVAIWVFFNDVSYKVPAGLTLDDVIDEAPWWASVLFWQGEQERSVRTHYGLDLVGGSQVVLEANLADLGSVDDLEGLMQAARVVVENRVSGGLGVVEPLVQLGGNNRIIVELPEVSEPDQAISLLKETGQLEFVEALQFPLVEGDRILTTRALELSGGEVASDTLTYPDQIFTTIMNGSHLEDAQVGLDQAGRRTVDFTLTAEGQEIFGSYTGQHVGDFLAIVLDGFVVSSPRIQAQITTRTGQITGGGSNGFAADEAEDMAIKLKYGALPIPLKVVENRTIGPSLGQESVDRSVRAGTIGLIVVLVFMLAYYRVPGIAACLTLGLYAGLNLALYKLIPVTLTVAGITGFILSIGMAVDANILVFERLKEELRLGRTMRSAIEASFRRAWPSIRDGNLSTLITCYILFVFGSSFGASIVKGFAVTLAIGVLLNLFTAVPATRVILRLLGSLFGNAMQENSAGLVGLNMPRPGLKLPESIVRSFMVVQKRRSFYLFSSIVIVLGLVAMGISFSQFGTPLKLSIDYTGGTLWEMRFEQDVSPDDVRNVITDAEYSVTAAQMTGEGSVLLRMATLDVETKIFLAEQITSQIGPFDERRFETVGPVIGEEVTQASGLAVGAASLAILAFIWYVFRSIPNSFRYGVGAIVAMLHDVLITGGVFALLGLILGWEVTALFLTAILTVIGYSVNDTIVVFDRIRENLPRRRSENYETVANRSLLETLNRSLATSLSTLFVIGAILVFGGATTQQFIAVMLIGIVSGTYSSIFTAVPFVVSWQQGDFQRS